MSIIIDTYKAQEVREGAGVIVNRVFGHGQTEIFDPFLMLDYFEMKETLDSPGFPWHPHKGIETISYFLKGSGEHQDSLGNKGIIGPGELQWMSAGSGIMHQEMPASSEGGAQGFQFWVNMPAKDKLNQPHYNFIGRDEMRIMKQEGAIIKVIAGSYKNLEGPIDKSQQGIRMLHIILEEGASIELTRHQDKNGFMFVFDGSGFIEDEKVRAYNAYVLDEGKFQLTANQNLQAIYAEGKPLKEPIVWYGPVVMNTREEIIETFRAIEEGTFINGNKH